MPQTKEESVWSERRSRSLPKGKLQLTQRLNVHQFKSLFSTRLIAWLLTHKLLSEESLRHTLPTLGSLSFATTFQRLLIHLLRDASNSDSLPSAKVHRKIDSPIFARRRTFKLSLIRCLTLSLKSQKVISVEVLTHSKLVLVLWRDQTPHSKYQILRRFQVLFHSR